MFYVFQKRRHYDLYMACNKIILKHKQRQFAEAQGRELVKKDGAGTLRIGQEIITGMFYSAHHLLTVYLCLSVCLFLSLSLSLTCNTNIPKTLSTIKYFTEIFAGSLR